MKNLTRDIRKFFGNIVGGFIPNRMTRHRVRVNIVAPLGRSMRFVKRQHANEKNLYIEKFYGLGGKSLCIGVNGKYVYKFSCMRNENDIALFEADIVSYFKNISPIGVPELKLLRAPWGWVRRYEYVHGTALSKIAPEKILKNVDSLGHQIAEFLYKVGCENPQSLAKYKHRKAKNDIPRMFYGWNHTDFDNLENFIVDEKTMKITYVIDWENSTFGDFYNRTYRTSQPHVHKLFEVVRRDYTKMFYDGIVK